MDCEPPESDISSYAHRKSSSGPDDYAESERSITGYVDVLERYGYTPTLFVHPRVAERQREFLIDLRERGVCLGLHLHPYKMDEAYRHDLGFYRYSTQRALLTEATDRWKNAMGRHPEYFRPGVFSANDSTFGLLEELGYSGGSVSSPGRVLPSAAAVWAGARYDPHRAHRGFRQLAGEADFVNVPMTVDSASPIQNGHANQRGYQSLYVSAVEEEEVNPDATRYDFDAMVENVVDRFESDRPTHPVVLTNTHNNMNYCDADHPATENLETVLDGLENLSSRRDVSLSSGTIESVVDAVLSE